MIRHLDRLMRPVEAAGPGALALAVYAEERDGAFVTVPAAQTGYEGVACVDDAGRAAVLYCKLWRRHRAAWAAERARALLRFIGYMQDADGRFCNFVEDWDGTKNRTCDNSRPGGVWWTARAMRAMAEGVWTFDEEECRLRFRVGLEWLDRPTNELRARALAVSAVLRMWQATGDRAAALRAIEWSEEIADARVQDVLPDRPGDPAATLWAHAQEAAVGMAGTMLGRPALVGVAARSARSVFGPPIALAFPAAATIPFDASSAALAMTSLAKATGDPWFAERAALARAWFSGRNAAGRPVYDRRRGLVHDGIDHGRINRNSGAESNIEGALALLPELPVALYRLAERPGDPRRVPDVPLDPYRSPPPPAETTRSNRET